MSTTSTVDDTGTRSPGEERSTATPGAVDRRFRRGLLRACGGALLFSFPMLMTMEMWWLGFAIDTWRLVLLMVLAVPLLVGLSYFAGFQETFRLLDDVVDAFVAYAVGFVTASAALLLIGVIGPDRSAEEIIGMIAVQAVPASIGAMLARSEFGGDEAQEQERRRRARYGGAIFLQAVGAIFLTLSLASTEEMVLIAHRLTEWQAVALALFSLLVMHAFGSIVGSRRQGAVSGAAPRRFGFLRLTVVGYAVALLVSGYILWTFGQTDDTALEEVVQVTIVLGFPAALGAAAARLIL